MMVSVAQFIRRLPLYWDIVDPSRLGRYRRLSRPVDGWLSRREEAILFALARRVPREQSIVELGSWLGKSAVLLGGGSRTGNGASVFCVDHFRALGLAKPVLEERARELSEDYLPAFQENMQAAGLDGVVQAIRSGSAEAGANWTGPSVGLLFIDADHSYDAVCRDWESWLGLVAPGATVAFHDYQNPSYDVTRFVDELIAAGRLRRRGLHDSILCGEVTR